MSNGEHGRARACWEESLALARTLGNTWGAQSLIAIVLTNLASAAAEQGDYERARPLAEEGLATARAIGHQRWSAYALKDLGRIALAQGNYTQAQVRFEESMLLGWEWGDTREVVESLENMALLVYTQAQDSEATPRAMRLFGAAAALRDVLNAPLLPMLPNFDSRIASTLAALRTQGDPTTWTAWWGEGRAMTLEQAMAYARDGVAADH
jgi:tetratricopeptide (TPR) repeat protein